VANKVAFLTRSIRNVNSILVILFVVRQLPKGFTAIIPGATIRFFASMNAIVTRIANPNYKSIKVYAVDIRFHCRHLTKRLPTIGPATTKRSLTCMGSPVVIKVHLQNK